MTWRADSRPPSADRDHSLEGEPALLLALLRIAIAVVVLASPEPSIARLVAERAALPAVHPEGLGWLGTVVPITPGLIAVAVRVLEGAAVLVLLGVWTRIALTVLSFMLLYVFGVAQLTGTVTHDMHLVWFSALLASLPGAHGPGAALGLDAWARGSLAGPPPSALTSRAVLVARLWLAMVYVFPGIHKLFGDFVGASSLRGQLYFKWYEAGGSVPWPRIDRSQALLGAGAVGVVLFELAMPVLVLVPRTRLVALACGLGFHLLCGHFLDVLFPSLLACYVLLLPGEALRQRLLRGASRPTGTGSDRPAWGAVGLASFVTVGLVFAGVRGRTQAFPFACYPTFADRPPKEIVDLAVDVLDGDHVTTLRLPARRRPDEWGMVWHLAGLYGEPVSPTELRAFADRLGSPPGVPRRWMVEEHDVSPEHYGEAPRRRVPRFVE